MVESNLVRLHALVIGRAGCRGWRRDYWDEVVVLGRSELLLLEVETARARNHTFLPTIATLPSAAHAIVKPSPPRATVAVHVLVFTSQNLHVPSLETDASSASFVGFHPTRSIAPVCPLNSVLLLT